MTGGAGGRFRLHARIQISLRAPLLTSDGRLGLGQRFFLCSFVYLSCLGS